jgi:hypothetical protein
VEPSAASPDRRRFNALSVVKLALQMLARTPLSAYQRRLVQTAVEAVNSHIEDLLREYHARQRRNAPRRPRGRSAALGSRLSGPYQSR